MNKQIKCPECKGTGKVKPRMKKFMYVIYGDKMVEVNKVGTTIQLLGDRVVIIK